MSTRIEIIDRINTSSPSNLFVEKIGEYANAYILTDFTNDDEIPNLRAVNQIVTNAVINVPPFFFSFLASDPYPVVIGGAFAILAPFIVGAAPGIIVRETGIVTKWRNPDCVTYDPIADELIIDLGTNLDGDLTIFKP